MCEASGTGAITYYDKIPVSDPTAAICGYYGIDPLKLISSGCMMIACKKSDELVQLLNQEGIPASVIGEMTENNSIILKRDGKDIIVSQPEADELYKAV